jgi:hypothetical protein
LSGTRRGPSFCWERGDEGISHMWGGKLASEGISPRQEKVAYERRLGTCPEGQDLWVHGKRILQGSLCHPPGNVHVGRGTEVLCDGLAEDIITTPGTVMVDMTD